MSTIEDYADVILEHIITDEQKAQAEEDIENESSAAWNSARLLVSLLDDEEVKGELPRGSVVRAVANLYGKSDKTISDREKVARLFPPGLVSSHPLVKSFSYWKTAADARHLKRKPPLESALDIIWRIEQHFEAYGKMPSVRTVEGWVYTKENEKVRLVWKIRMDSISSLMEKIQHDRYAPQEGRDLIGWMRGMLLSYIETGESPLMDGQLQDHHTLESETKGGNPG